MKTIAIKTEYIKLDQFLKYVGVAETAATPRTGCRGMCVRQRGSVHHAGQKTAARATILNFWGTNLRLNKGKSA